MRKRNLIILVLFGVTVAAGAVLLVLSSNSSRTYAKPAGAEHSEIRGYEYCAVTKLVTEETAGKLIGTASICYIREERYHCEKVSSTVTGRDPQETAYLARDAALLKAISKLGNEGWEMVGEGFPFATKHTLDADRALYFKRLRR